MKILLLSVALLLFTGVQSDAEVQQKEPEQFSLWKLFEETVGILHSAVTNIDYSKIAKDLQVNERVQAAKKNYDKIEDVMEEYFEEVWKTIDDDIKEKFPTLRTKIVPIMKKFEVDLEVEVGRVGRELSPVASDLMSGVKQHLAEFSNHMENIAAAARDKMRLLIDKLRTDMEPYTDEFNQEYSKYEESLKSNLGTTLGEYQEEIKNEYKQLMEKIQPYVGSVNFESPNMRKFQRKINKFMSELLDSGKEKHKGKGHNKQ